MFIISCPHCQELIEIEQVNCCIFRHGVFKDTGKQVPPHAPKVLCDQWVLEGRVYGCCKPFRLVRCSNGNYQPEECGYI